MISKKLAKLKTDIKGGRDQEGKINIKMDRILTSRIVMAVLGVMFACLSSVVFAESRVRSYKFNVVMKNTTRLCSTKPIVTVNGNYPGPTIVAREDDTVQVKVVNHVKYNVTIHWHGIKQLRTGWADGPAYITQCPIQPGHNYVYKFHIKGQRGTLFWHAHILWLRATVHGAIVILPKLGVPYPFPKPDKESILVLGEWWKSDVEAVINEAMESGLAPNVSDAHTINGYPGLVRSSNCHSQKQYNLVVEQGKRYLLRIINAALNEELFFKVTNHNLTVVEVDASYVKPFKTNTIVISPGQTTNAILEANQSPNNNYLITVSPFMDAPILVDNVTATATIQYSNPGPSYTSTSSSSTSTTLTATIPPQNATSISNQFRDSLKSLNSKDYPVNVPLKIDRSLVFTTALGVNPCRTCVRNSRVVADFSNITFVMPKVALLQAHYYNISGVFTDDFPDRPLHGYDYTGMVQPSNFRTRKGTKVYRLPYNATVQLVLQDTGMIAPENHPIHLHGHNFYVVGRGLGNYNARVDSYNFNVVDPVERNTVDVPSGGWTAIRFRADNPGVWFMHCHLEVHTSWGLKMAFVVDNGKGPNECLFPPPRDLPKC